MTMNSDRSERLLRFFAYEEEYRVDLRFIPMLLRYKLDLTGRSVSLDAWKALPYVDRRTLVDAPFASEDDRLNFAERMDFIVGTGHGSAAKSIVDVSIASWTGLEIPTLLVDRAREHGTPIDGDSWRAISPFDRYALAKLGGGEKKSRNLDSVLDELFGAGTP